MKVKVLGGPSPGSMWLPARGPVTTCWWHIFGWSDFRKNTPCQKSKRFQYLLSQTPTNKGGKAWFWLDFAHIHTRDTFLHPLKDHHARLQIFDPDRVRPTPRGSWVKAPLWQSLVWIRFCYYSHQGYIFRSCQSLSTQIVKFSTLRGQAHPGGVQIRPPCFSKDHAIMPY